MCYSEHMTENMIGQQETAVAESEGTVNTSAAQASDQNAERSYEVVAVIPIELFTQQNLKFIQDELKKDENDYYQFVPIIIECKSSNKKGRDRIEQHINNFSSYCYKIFQIKPKNESCGQSLHCTILKMLNEKIKDIKFVLDQIEILLAVPASVEADGSQDSAEMFDNTSITISIIVSVDDSKIGKDSNDKEKNDKAKKLKAIGDTLKELVGENATGESAEKRITTILKNENSENCNNNGKIKSIIHILGKGFEEEVKNNSGNEENTGPSDITRLDEMIEVNYVFTYFICYGYKYHIIVDKILDVEDNIKYSGDAWFLKSSTVGLYKLKDGAEKGQEGFDYISENYWNSEKKNNDHENSGVESKYEKEENTHGWLVNELIPESQIRPSDIFYIPKINGREDYSSVILRYVNRFCCFVKDSEKFNRKHDSDDGNRVIGMQIVLQSFWHRMTEFSRVLQQLSQKYNLELNTKERFMNQVHTTPTVADQIVDVNSDDVDVVTLLDLAQATKIDSAARIFNESKQTYLAIDAHKQTEERSNAAEKANRGLQSMFLALALLTYALGLTELWGEWTAISNFWKAIITILFPVILAVFYFGFYYWEKLRERLSRVRKKSSAR